MSLGEAAERDLIEGTMADIREALQRLEAQRGELDGQIREKRERLAAWQARLDRLPGPDSAARVRRSKGQNLRSILALYEDPTTALTIADITRRTQLPSSSVRATLKRSDSPFEEGSGGLWKVKQANGRREATV